MPYLAFQAASSGIVPELFFAARPLTDLPSLLARGLALVETGYQRAPVLALVLPVLILLPLVALISFAIHRAGRAKARRAVERRLLDRAEEASDWTPQPATGIGIPAWGSQAWLTVEGKGDGTVPLAGKVIRIGRNEDNDIRLTDKSVHRYHAVIERTPEEAFVITDLSGEHGNGIRVNGARTAKAQLSDGDVIELGRAKLKFENAPV